MKAVILAAGVGTRLKPITNNTPKCLVKVSNEPILQYQIEKVEPYKIIIKLVVTERFTTADKNKISESLTEYLKDKIQWELEIVDKIPISKSGKFKLLIDKTRNQDK